MPFSVAVLVCFLFFFGGGDGMFQLGVIDVYIYIGPTLQISGFFGAGFGEAYGPMNPKMLDGNAIQMVTWDEKLVVCSLPRTMTGPLTDCLGW